MTSGRLFHHFQNAAPQYQSHRLRSHCVPNGFGVNHHHRAFVAYAEAAGVGHQHIARQIRSSISSMKRCTRFTLPLVWQNPFWNAVDAAACAHKNMIFRLDHRYIIPSFDLRCIPRRILHSLFDAAKARKGHHTVFGQFFSRASPIRIVITAAQSSIVACIFLQIHLLTAAFAVAAGALSQYFPTLRLSTNRTSLRLLQ
jgi:hypothetical protein